MWLAKHGVKRTAHHAFPTGSRKAAAQPRLRVTPLFIAWARRTLQTSQRDERYPHEITSQPKPAALRRQLFNTSTSPSINTAPRKSVTGSLHFAPKDLESPFRGLNFSSSRPRYLPRAPPTARRSVTDLGLGTARNFSSGQTIFQSLTESAAPVTYPGLPLHGKTAPKHRRRHAKRTASTPLVDQWVRGQRSEQVEFDQYFASPATSSATTYLLIPLQPTSPEPTHQTSVVGAGSEAEPLLPFSTIGPIHMSYELHSLRVSSLFSRLDAANVWNRGAQCDAYTESATGACTILKVEFTGWTEAEVREVVGESGKGWCVLEEAK